MSQPIEAPRSAYQIFSREGLLGQREMEPGIRQAMINFLEMAKIPSETGNEKDLRKVLERFADQYDLPHQRDEIGNLLIKVPASAGYEGRPGSILQTHMDMVCVAEKGKDNPAIKGAIPIIDPEDPNYIKADGTTLGADPKAGLSVALGLVEEILDPNSKVKHGPLAILATVQEETGLFGARKCQFDLGKYQFMFNLDSEREGKATVGCSGAGNSILEMPLTTETASIDKRFYRISISGGIGGHSAGNIMENRANAIKLLASTFAVIRDKNPEMQIQSIGGGYFREDQSPINNAIPGDAQGVVAINSGSEEELSHVIDEIKATIKTDYPKETKLQMSLEDVSPLQQTVMTAESTTKLIDLLIQLPHGVQAEFPDISYIPKTSINLATIRISEGSDRAIITLMSRSADFADLNRLRSQIKGIAEGRDATVEEPEAYSGWMPNENPSYPINAQAIRAYKEITGADLSLVSTHGGLEGGPFSLLYPHLQIISIGPQIDDAHTTRERLSIPSYVTFYRMLKRIISNFSSSDQPLE